METKKVFDEFLNDLKSAFPEIQIPNYDIDATVKEFESNYYPNVLKIIQRDGTFFDEPRMFCGLNLSEFWKSESTHEAIWKHLQMCLFSSFFHGDIKEKIGGLVSTFKGLWGSSNDEISKILNDENVEDHFSELLEYLQETRLAKIFHEIAEKFDISELELNLENPQEMIDLLKNPENPAIKKVVAKFQNIFQEKIQKGEFTQQQIMAEVEGIKSKIQSLFGNFVNEMLGLPTRSKENRPVYNTPQGRAMYQRDRLRRKLEEKYKKDKNS